MAMSVRVHRAMVLVVGGSLMLGASMLGGCANSKDYNAAVDSSRSLRDRNAQLESDLARVVGERDAANARATEAASLNDQLARALEDAANEVQRLKAAPATLATNTPAATGRGPEVVIAVAGDVLFESGKATIRPSAHAELNRIARRLNSEFGSRTIRVEGYTDTDQINRSGWKSNRHLSAERAIAVEEYLVAQGVNNARIYSAAFGETRPRGSKQQSRRVEIVVLAN